MPSSKVSDLAPDISSTAIRCWHWNWCVPFMWVLELVFYSLIFVSEHNLFKHCGYKLLTAKWIAFFDCTIHALAQIFLMVVDVVIAIGTIFQLILSIDFFKVFFGHSKQSWLLKRPVDVSNHTFRLPLWVMEYSASFCNMQHVCFQKFMYTLCSSVSKLEVCKLQTCYVVVFVIVLEVAMLCFLLMNVSGREQGNKRSETW